MTAVALTPAVATLVALTAALIAVHRPDPTGRHLAAAFAERERQRWRNSILQQRGNDLITAARTREA